jgi:hypothetical protein
VLVTCDRNMMAAKGTEKGFGVGGLWKSDEACVCGMASMTLCVACGWGLEKKARRLEESRRRQLDGLGPWKFFCCCNWKLVLVKSFPLFLRGSENPSDHLGAYRHTAAFYY